jgi:hypothetical protein
MVKKSKLDSSLSHWRCWASITQILALNKRGSRFPEHHISYLSCFDMHGLSKLFYHREMRINSGDNIIPAVG